MTDYTTFIACGIVGVVALVLGFAWGKRDRRKTVILVDRLLNQACLLSRDRRWDELSVFLHHCCGMTPPSIKAEMTREKASDGIKVGVRKHMGKR